MFIKKNWENLLECKNIKMLEFKCFYTSILKLYLSLLYFVFYSYGKILGTPRTSANQDYN